MAHTLRPPKQISYDENAFDPSDYLKDIKQEPLDIPDEQSSLGVKNEYFEYQNENLEYPNEHFEYQNEAEFNQKDPFSSSSNIWELLVKRCRFLIQEEQEYSRMNSHLITKILIKEVNELLSNVVTFFQDCCISVEQNENYVENVLEVDGLLINCLPCHPQNLSCHYKISNDIPHVYLETLFSPLDNEVEENIPNDNDFLPLAPQVELDVKKEGNADIKAIKKNKPGKKAKEKLRKVCEQCGKDFKTTSDLKVHVSSVHEKKRPWKCNKCGDTYRNRSGLLGHKKGEYGKCPGKPRNSRKLIFFGKNPGVDPKCLHPDCVDKDLPRFTYAGIMKHVIELHSPDPDDSKNLQCPDCPKRIPMASVLKFHRELEHGLKASVCNLCGKTVTKMKQHMLFVHTSEKQLQCDKCEFRTNNKSNLKRHMIRHSDDPMAGRKCVCEICHKAFYTNQELRQHLLIHGGIKPYKCNLCSSTFSNFSGHRQHMMRTHGLKFTCDICGKDSSSMAGLGIHKRDKHGIAI